MTFNTEKVDIWKQQSFRLSNENNQIDTNTTVYELN